MGLTTVDQVKKVEQSDVVVRHDGRILICWKLLFHTEHRRMGIARSVQSLLLLLLCGLLFVQAQSKNRTGASKRILNQYPLELHVKVKKSAVYKQCMHAAAVIELECPEVRKRERERERRRVVAFRAN